MRIPIRLLLALVVLLVGCKGELVFIGDSHTRGICTDDPCVPFTEVVAENLRGIYNVKALGFAAMPLTVMALSDNPFTTMVAPYVDGASVSVMLARGDVFYAPGGIPPEWFEVLVVILENRLLAAGATRVIFNTSPPSYYDQEQWQQDLLAEYHEILTGDGRGPDNWAFLDERHFPDCSGDCIHLNQAGHLRLGDVMSWFWMLQ